MRCRKCGASVPADSLYCNYCGSKIIRSADRDLKKTRPREENFDDVNTARVSGKKTKVQKAQKVVPILLIVLAGAIFAVSSVLIFQVMKSHQRTIVTPGKETLEADTLPPVTTKEPTTAEPTTETEEPTTEAPTVIEEGSQIEYQNITYEVRNGSLTLIKCRSLESIIELPESIEGFQLTEIGEEAFAYCSHLQYIDIPEGVEAIRDRAFYYCTNLREIVLPSTLKESEFGVSVMDYCSGYKVICIPNTFSYWLAVNNGITWVDGDSITVVLH